MAEMSSGFLGFDDFSGPPPPEPLEPWEPATPVAPPRSPVADPTSFLAPEAPLNQAEIAQVTAFILRPLEPSSDARALLRLLQCAPEGTPTDLMPHTGIVECGARLVFERAALLHHHTAISRQLLGARFFYELVLLSHLWSRSRHPLSFITERYRDVRQRLAAAPDGIVLDGLTSPQWRRLTLQLERLEDELARIDERLAAVVVLSDTVQPLGLWAFGAAQLHSQFQCQHTMFEPYETACRICNLLHSPL